MPEEYVGKITHYYGKIGVAVVELEGVLKEGDRIIIKRKDGSTFEQTVASMEIEHKKVKSARKGQSIGLKVNEKVREGDLVYKIV